MPKHIAKLTRIMFDPEFDERMRAHNAMDPRHKALIVVLYLTGIRISEALRAQAKQFKLTPMKLYFDVGLRLKRSKLTPALPMPLTAPHVSTLIDAYRGIPKDSRVFPYVRKTGYNIAKRFITYPHYFRMNRITRFFLDGYTIPEVKAWTGLSLSTLNYYIGQASIEKMSESLGSSLLKKNPPREY